MSNSTQGSQRPFYRVFADKVIAQLEAGTIPWEKPWGISAYDPFSGTVYSGANRLWLDMSASAMGTQDPRWLSIAQVNKENLSIKKGSKGTLIYLWQWEERIKVLDEQGSPILDENGKEKYLVRALEKPILRETRVFNGSQIEGFEPCDVSLKRLNNWESEKKAEDILRASKAQIFHDQTDRAFYSQSKDEIHLPPKEHFPNAITYYATALHELAHWTGHADRLDREVGGFGTEKYAKEELRAELASWMLLDNLGITHKVENHTVYISSWVELLKYDPIEIIRACRDAEKAMDFVMSMYREKSIEQEKGTAGESIDAQKKSPEILLKQGKGIPEVASEKTLLYVPFAEKDAAKAAGALWDNAKRSWYAPEGLDLQKVQAWLVEKQEQTKALKREKTCNPQQELAQSLQKLGLDLRGEPPVLDGKIHRVPLSNDTPGERSGAYCAYSDGLPAGWAQNYRTGEKIKWIASGHTLTEEEKVQLRQEAVEQREKRLQEQKELHNKVALECSHYYANTYTAPSDHPYLARKKIFSEPIKESPRGETLIVPLINTEGEIRSLQYIHEDGTKRFHRNGEKYGNFFLLGADIKRDAKNLSTGEVLLAEGVATGVSIHTATQKPVAVCFDAGNLAAVATKLRKKFPQMAITLCADNDHQHKKENLGLLRAEEAAHKVGGKVIVPNFTKEEMAQGLKDFNDLQISRGLKEVQAQIGKGLQHKVSKNKGISR